MNIDFQITRWLWFLPRALHKENLSLKHKLTEKLRHELNTLSKDINFCPHQLVFTSNSAPRFDNHHSLAAHFGGHLVPQTLPANRNITERRRRKECKFMMIATYIDVGIYNAYSVFPQWSLRGTWSTPPRFLSTRSKHTVIPIKPKQYGNISFTLV